MIALIPNIIIKNLKSIKDYNPKISLRKKKNFYPKMKSNRLFDCLLSISLFSGYIPINSKNTISLASIIVDGSIFDLKQEKIINESFLFNDKTTIKSEVESEIDDLEDDEYRYSVWKNTQVGVTVGGSALGIWFCYKGLNKWENWMKEQEQKDIDEEIEMTGTYINPGANNVETSIDPKTGKKIEIKQETEKKKEDKDK